MNYLKSKIAICPQGSLDLIRNDFILKYRSVRWTRRGDSCEYWVLTTTCTKNAKDLLLIWARVQYECRAISYYGLDYFAQNNRSVWRYAAINADRNDYLYHKSQVTSITAVLVICRYHSSKLCHCDSALYDISLISFWSNTLFS